MVLGSSQEAEMKERVIATYERESTLWKNANAFYVSQDWVKMECIVCDYSEDIKSIKELGVQFWEDGKDVTEREIQRRYGKPYVVRFTNKRRTNSTSYSFETKEAANEFFKTVMKDKILKNFRRVS